MQKLPTSKFESIKVYKENDQIVKAFREGDHEIPAWINNYSKFPRILLETEKIKKEFKQQLLDAFQNYEPQNGIYLPKNYKWQKKNWW